ncbi:MAG: DUF3310 domain-containing protein [Cetobacterium sp.]
MSESASTLHNFRIGDRVGRIAAHGDIDEGTVLGTSASGVRVRWEKGGFTRPSTDMLASELFRVDEALPRDNTTANARQVGGEHYRTLAVQPWDALRAWLTPEEFRGYMKGNAIVYLARERAKGGATDIGKAEHYLQKLLEVLTAPDEPRGA